MKVDDSLSEEDFSRIESGLNVKLDTLVATNSYLVAAPAMWGEQAQDVRGIKWVGARKDAGKVAPMLREKVNLS